MKNLTFTVVLGLFTFHLFGQNYHKILTKDRYFDVSANSGKSICRYTSAARFYVASDTVVNGVLYKRLNAHQFIANQAHPFCPPFKVRKESYYSGVLMREDTVLKKVYAVYEYESLNEILLYDFSMKLGDSLDFGTFGWAKLKSINQIKLKDGSLRLKYTLDNNNFFIEGIGGSEGVYNQPFFVIGSWADAMCVMENGKEIYGYDCGYQFVNVNEIDKGKTIEIYPNPAREVITIHYNNIPSHSKVECVNELGVVVYSKDVNNNSGMMEIDLSKNNIVSGIYELRIVSGEWNSGSHSNVRMSKRVLVIRE